MALEALSSVVNLVYQSCHIFRKTSIENVILKKLCFYYGEEVAVFILAVKIGISGALVCMGRLQDKLVGSLGDQE